MNPSFGRSVGLAAVLVLVFSVGRATAPSASLAQNDPPPAWQLGNTAAPQRPGAPEAPLAQNTSGFTYQGQLRKNGAPVSAACNASFRLYDAATGGAQLGGTVTSATLQVAQGLFTIPLDFGWVFNGEARWLETAIGCGEAQSTLAPRTPLRPAPYAFALPGLRTVPGDVIAGQPTMNVIGGIVTGSVSSAISSNSYHSAILGGYVNRIDGASPFSAIGGGEGNRIATSSGYSAIDGGSNNAVGGTSSYAAIGAGSFNVITQNSAYSAIGGGYGNRVESLSFYSAIGGGDGNSVQRNSRHASIGGGLGNAIGFTTTHATISGGNFNEITRTSGYGAIGGGGRNRIDYLSDYGNIGGGYDNSIDQSSSVGTIGGGESNRIRYNSIHSVIGGGYGNVISSSIRGTIGGGYGNVITATSFGTIPGGYQAKARSYGEQAYATGGFNGVPGSAQTSVYVLRNTTIGAVTSTLYLDGAASEIDLVPGRAYVFEIQVIGVEDGPGSLLEAFRIEGAAYYAGVICPCVVGVVKTVIWSNFSGMDVVVGDPTQPKLRIRAKGTAGNNVRWVATVRTTEVSW